MGATAQMRNTSLNHPSKEVNWLKRKLPLSNNPNEKIEIYHGLAQVYSQWGKPNSAIWALSRAVEIADSINNYKSRYEKRRELAKLYARNHDIRTAKNIMNEVMEISQSPMDKEKAKKLVDKYG